MSESAELLHLALDVEHFLLHARPEDYLRTFVGERGELLEWQDARALLLREQQLGHRFLPIGSNACDGFDYRTGCPGHPL